MIFTLAGLYMGPPGIGVGRVCDMCRFGRFAKRGTTTLFSTNVTEAQAWVLAIDFSSAGIETLIESGGFDSSMTEPGGFPEHRDWNCNWSSSSKHNEW